MLNFFIAASGRSPIKKYLDDLDKKTRDKLLTQFSYLKKYGANSAIPNSKKVTNDLWELRILGKANIRIIFAPVKERCLYILHIFNKKSKKTPRRDIKLAFSRLKLIIDRDI